MLNIGVDEVRAFREARDEVRQEIALNLLKNSFPLEQIVRVPGLTIAQVQALQVADS